jgi:hypothetical protein
MENEMVDNPWRIMDIILRGLAFIVLFYLALMILFDRYIEPNCGKGFVPLHQIGSKVICAPGHWPT